MKNKKVVLIILDGWGIAETWGGNAIALANTPNIDSMIEKYPNTLLLASGEAVGLPFDEPGNSEVGHFNIGTGQTADQGLTAINDKIKDRGFYKNKILNNLIDETQKRRKTLHIIGLLSDGGIHSHINHLLALLDLAKEKKFTKISLHIFTDGRDSSPTSGIKYLKTLEDKLDEVGFGVISSISGRYFAMDRDNHWDRIKKAYDAITGSSSQKSSSARNVLLKSYASGTTDEFMEPTSIKNGKPISDGDSVLFFNFRSDRARQLTRALVLDGIKDFKGSKKIKNLDLATFASYQEGLNAKVVFEASKVSGQLSKILSDHNLSHLHIAETEKYAHVTYFFNGGIENPFEGEERILVPSPKVATYNLKPEMSAESITEKVSKLIGNYNFTVINYANADMVGHTGDFQAAQKAVETIDKCAGRLVELCIKKEITVLITADHGNAEQMINPLTGMPDTEHTTSPVPFIVISKKKYSLKNDGSLSDLVPTILDIMGIDKPKEAQGNSLLLEVDTD